MKNIEDQENLAGKIALLRLDLNVPLKNKDILDETRIDKIIPVINFLLNRKTKILVISHVGRPKGEFYKMHMDFGPDIHMTRKLSITVQLSDENSYDGGDLIIYYSGEHYIAPKAKGTVIVFDSRLTHEVTPIIKGERHSLVKWFHGDKPLS